MCFSDYIPHLRNLLHVYQPSRRRRPGSVVIVVTTVARIGKFTHITPVQRDVLHWLAVSKRTQFKLALLAFDCVRAFRGMGPTYFTRVCVPVSDNTVRSIFVLLNMVTCSFLLERERSWEQGVSACLPLLCGTYCRLSLNSRDTFMSRLKSHFYADAYRPIFIKSENVRV